MKRITKLINLTMITGLILSPLSVSALQKTENVYSNLNPDGTITKTIVSNHLSWLDEGEFEDDSELKDILNLNGEETFTQKGTKLTWKSLGNDIFYQGQTEKQQPIQTEIKYFLNDKESKAEEILGKEGKVKIELIFQNNLKNIVNLNGKNTEMYTPFITTIGTMLDNKNNKNIQINNGKVISTGTRSMIVGLASPGLFESIGLNELKDSNKITLSYETTSFSMNSIYIVSTPKLLEESDLKIFDKMDNLSNDMYELQKNMDKLEQGINELEKGTHKLANGSNELMQGIKSANNAVEQLKNGSITLNQGLKQIINSLETMEKELSNITSTETITKLTTLKNQNNQTINTLISKTNMTLENIQNYYNQNNLANYQGNDLTLLNVKQTYELIYLLQMNNQAIDISINTLKNMNNKLNSLLVPLKNALNATFTGSTKLKTGLEDLKKGMNKLYDGSTSLNNGIIELSKASNNLSKGASEFNKQGINKLNNYVNTIKFYSNKLEALQNLSKNYNGFTSNNSTSTHFISTVKSIKITYKR